MKLRLQLEIEISYISVNYLSYHSFVLDLLYGFACYLICARNRSKNIFSVLQLNFTLNIASTLPRSSIAAAREVFAGTSAVELRRYSAVQIIE